MTDGYVTSYASLHKIFKYMMLYTSGMSGDTTRDDIQTRTNRLLVSQQRNLYAAIMAAGASLIGMGIFLFVTKGGDEDFVQFIIGGGDQSFVLQGAAFIMIGALGWVMALTNSDIGAGIRESVAADGDKTRSVIVADGDKTRSVIVADGDKTRSVIVADGDKTRSVIVDEGAKTREAITKMAAESKDESARTRSVLISINDTLATMADAMKSNGVGGTPPGAAGPRAPLPG